MTGDSMLSLQKAVYEALSHDEQLAMLVTGVYDYVPQGSSLPYVSIGQLTAEEFGSHTTEGMNVLIQIDTWYRGTGRKGLRTIMGNVYRVLHKSALAVEGQHLIDIRFEFADTDLDPDGVTFHGVQRFRALTQGV